jgi:WD40 repeat protein
MKVYDAWYGAGGALLATAGWGATAILDARTGGVLDSFSATRYLSQHQIAWSRAGVLAVYGTDDANVYLWDARKQARAGGFSARPLSVSSLAWSPDGSTLAAASREGVTLFRDGTPVRTLRERGPLAYGLAWSPDGALVATGDERAVTLWDVATGAFTELTRESGDAMSVAFSADGQLLASASRDGKVRIWDVPSRAFVTTLEGYPAQPRSVAWSPLGKTPGERVLIVAAGTIHLYRPADARSVWLRAFSDAGKRVGLAVSDDGAYSGEPAALARVRFRASPDVRAPLSPQPLAPPQPELVLDFMSGCGGRP